MIQSSACVLDGNMCITLQHCSNFDSGDKVCMVINTETGVEQIQLLLTVEYRIGFGIDSWLFTHIDTNRYTLIKIPSI